MKEFKHGKKVQVKIGMIWHSRVYIGAYQEHHIVGDTLGGIEEHSDTLIRKKAPSFEDVEIDWIEDIGYIRNEDGDTIGVHNLSICSYLTFGTLSRYVFDDQGNGYGGKFTADTPMLFNTNGTEIESKATHARFVKIN